MRNSPGSKPSSKHRKPSRFLYFTLDLVLVNLVAASSGLLFGFDNGIIGGITGSADFQRNFLPDVYRANYLEPGSSSNYCKYDSQVLQLIVSCLYLSAGLTATIAGRISDLYGRHVCLRTAGILLLVGIGFCAGAEHIAMVVIGRMFMGGGVGFANSSAVLYIVEVAPSSIRGGMAIMFQLVQCVGIEMAYGYNFGFNTIEWGWRLSFALGGIHAVVLIAGAFCLPDTPISLLQRDKDCSEEKARKALEQVRGTDNVDAEFEDMLQIVKAAKKVPNSFKSLLLNPRYRPQLATVISMPIFQQWTGINSVIFYTPQIFSYVSRVKGLKDTVVVGAVNVAATVVAVFLVDVFGRRKLFAQGGLMMAGCMIIIAATLGTQYGKHPDGKLPTPIARGLLGVFSAFCAAYAWSFGPLPWLLPAEVQPLETRAAAASMNTTLNMLMTFVLSQTFQSQLCAMRFGVFLWFAALEILFVALILAFLPETKDKSMDQIAASFGEHWFWKKLRHVREYGEERGALVATQPQASMPHVAVRH